MLKKISLLSVAILLIFLTTYTISLAADYTSLQQADEEYILENIEYEKTKQIIVTNNYAESTERLIYCNGVEEDLSTNINKILADDIKINEIDVAFNNTSQLINEKLVNAKEPNESFVVGTQNVDYIANVDETFALAVIIFCEAGNQSYEGKVAVGNVVLNRVASPRFKEDTIISVIRAPGQFSPVGSGWYDRELRKGTVNESCMQAALDALAGVNVVGDRLFFHVWNGREPGLVIGAHVFQ